MSRISLLIVVWYLNVVVVHQPMRAQRTCHHVTNVTMVMMMMTIHQSCLLTLLMIATAHVITTLARYAYYRPIFYYFILFLCFYCLSVCRPIWPIWRSQCHEAVKQFEDARVAVLQHKRAVRKGEAQPTCNLGAWLCDSCSRICHSRIGLFTHQLAHR